MPYYEIHYRDDAGDLLATHCAPCAEDKHARILAHAMRPAGTRRIEVWKDATCIYERPETHYAAAVEALRPHLVQKAAE